MENFIDVHIFDGTLQKIHGVKLETVKYSEEEKKNKYNILISKLRNTEAISMVNIISSGIGNYQEENNLDASDLLVNILYKEYDDLISILEEQLVDMLNLGQCPSGRVTRLISILLSLQ